MKKVKLIRIHGDDKQTLGVWTVIEDGKMIFFCKTLELPDKNNASKISCIPKGVYDCEMTYSPAFKKKLYLIKNVPGRSGIRIHSANFVKQLRGCVALGSAAKDIDIDGNLDIIHSGDTVSAFEKLMGGEPFKLEIV